MPWLRSESCVFELGRNSADFGPREGGRSESNNSVTFSQLMSSRGVAPNRGQQWFRRAFQTSAHVGSGETIGFEKQTLFFESAHISLGVSQDIVPQIAILTLVLVLQRLTILARIAFFPGPGAMLRKLGASRLEK